MTEGGGPGASVLQDLASYDECAALPARAPAMRIGGTEGVRERDCGCPGARPERPPLMLDALLSDRRSDTAVSAALVEALEGAAGAIARLDQALDNHPLRTAFLYRARLDAVRRQASVDGHGIDPWHLAAALEGLRLRMDHALRIVDRGQIFEAARTALTLHQWIVEPDFDQEGDIQEAERHLANAAGLVGVGEALWSWLDSGLTRPPVRGALVRFWTKNRLLRAPVPLTGPRALSAEAPHGRADWMVAFLDVTLPKIMRQVNSIESIGSACHEL